MRQNLNKRTQKKDLSLINMTAFRIFVLNDIWLFRHVFIQLIFFNRQNINAIIECRKC